MLNCLKTQIFRILQLSSYLLENGNKSHQKNKLLEDPLSQLSLREISIVQGLIKLNISNQVSQVHIYFVVNLIIFNFKY